MTMFKTLSLLDQVDYLSELFAESSLSVAYVPYQKLSESQQQRVKVMFFDSLNQNEIELTKEVVEESEKQFINSPLPSLLRQYGYTVKVESKYTEVAKQLTKGKKVTLVKYSDFGMPVMIHTVIECVEIKPYAQYNDSLTIIHKPKRKRSIYKNIILPYQELIVFDGWIDTDIKKVSHETIKETDTYKMEQWRYTSFDKSFFTDFLEYVKIKPLVIVM